MADARWSLCMGQGMGFFGDLADAASIGVLTGLIGGPECGLVFGALSLGLSTAFDNDGSAVIAGTKASFDRCYQNCDPYSPSGGCSPGQIFAALATGGI